jgi:hypothetical protein
MTVLEQPDLFGEWDAQQEREAEQQRLREQEMQPQSCPYCGREEPSGWLLNVNHNVGWETGKANAGWDKCLAQMLRSNHLIAAVRQGRDRTPYIERVIEVKVDPEPVIKQAEAELPSLCLGCRHNKKPDDGDYCMSTPCQEKANQ